MTRRRMIIIGAAPVAVVVAVAVWFFVISDNAPPPLTLDAAVASATTAVPTTAAGPVSTLDSPATSDAPAPTTSPGAPVATSGPWIIDPDPAATIVGYRIQEELAGFGGNTAVGRTSEVTGTLVLNGASIVVVEVTVDMSTLVSDDRRRDSQMRSRGLETTSFPQAGFVLNSPIDLDHAPVVGEVIEAQGVGTFTLHGVSRDVTVSLEAQLVDEMRIVVVGEVEVALADYDIERPVGGSILSVADSGTFEFQLTFVG